jgi:hypothetical protein
LALLPQAVLAPPLKITQVKYLLNRAGKNRRPKKMFFPPEAESSHQSPEADQSHRIRAALNPKNP